MWFWVISGSRDNFPRCEVGECWCVTCLDISMGFKGPQQVAGLALQQKAPKFSKKNSICDMCNSYIANPNIYIYKPHHHDLYILLYHLHKHAYVISIIHITHSIKSYVHIFHSTSGKKSFWDAPTCTAASSSKMLPCEELRTWEADDDRFNPLDLEVPRGDLQVPGLICSQLEIDDFFEGKKFELKIISN